MARFATALANPLPAINLHLVGGITLFALTSSVLGSIALFGSDRSARPMVSLNVPSLADSASVHAGLRPESANSHGPSAITSHNAEPSLSGVHGLPSNPSAAAHEPTATHQTVIPQSADALGPVPIAGLTEPGPGGLLPKIGADGQRPSTAYARPYQLEAGKPVVSLVVGGLGMMKRTTMAAIEDLPPEVTLSFVPYTPDLQTWISQARAFGHEVLIELPMEPFGYPDTDPGPYTLLSTASSAENTRRLEWLLSRTSGYFGVTNYMGSKLTASEHALASIFRGLNHRGIDFLYDGETRRSSLTKVAEKEGLTWSTADRIIDAKQTVAAIDDQLLRLEAMAIQNGSAIGKGFSWPVTIKQLKEWTGSLSDKGYQLAPVSAVIKMRNQKANNATAAHAPEPAGASHH
ncbi:MAG: hypothetical protein COA47_13370 [Robiginitomaculum sp.]|nr:MAG: hypothetical protein COA47_13370 [Robiginitomaculum sp.]